MQTRPAAWPDSDMSVGMAQVRSGGASVLVVGGARGYHVGSVGQEARFGGSIPIVDKRIATGDALPYRKLFMSVAFEVPSVNGSWSGVLEADDVTLSGMWKQGGTHPLRLVLDTFEASTSFIFGFARPLTMTGLGHKTTPDDAS